MNFPLELPFEFPLEILPGATITGGDGAGSLRPMISHCDEALARLIEQYKESPRIKALICALVRPVQRTDDAIAQIYAALIVDEASGDLLDRIGKLVGERRGTRSLASFRAGIKTRILINRSQGRIPDLISIAALLAGVSDETGALIRLVELQPACVEIHVDRSPVVDARDLHQRMLASKAAGVALSTITLIGPRTRAIRLCRAVDQVSGNFPEGLSWTGNTAWGGDLAHVLR